MFVCFFNIYFILFYFIYLWLHWVFVSVQGLSLVVASRDHSSSRCTDLSLSRPLLLRSTGSRRAGSAIVAHGPSCVACEIFPDQGSNPYPLHWQADSQPLRHQGSPGDVFLKCWTPTTCFRPTMGASKKCRSLGLLNLNLWRIGAGDWLFRCPVKSETSHPPGQSHCHLTCSVSVASYLVSVLLFLSPYGCGPQTWMQIGLSMGRIKVGPCPNQRF